MADRPRRNIRQLNYRRIHFLGIDEDSSEDEISDEEEDGVPILEVSDEETNSVTASDESNSESEEDEATDDSLVAPDGTVWNVSPPRTPRPPAWRTSLVNYNDGPIGDAVPTINNPLTSTDIFGLMLTDETLQEICHWTNLYAHHIIQDWNDQHPQLKRRIWIPLTIVELRGLLGLLLLAGIEKPRKKPWAELWATSPLARCPPFPATMSRTRFYNLLNMLRFDDVINRRQQKEEATRDPTIFYNKLDPIKVVFTNTVGTFIHLFQPGAKLTVDEQIVKFRGNCPFRVYMPAKPGKYGIKIWALVDASSGFILNLQVYQGQIGSAQEVGQSKRVVLDLIPHYYGTNRGIVADNFFSSMELLKILLDNGLTFCGTIRKSRREIPAVIKDLAGASEGSHKVLYHQDTYSSLVRYVPKKNRYVLLLSSAHYSDITVTTSSKKDKPSVVDYYNALKGSVDTADEMLGTYTSQFPSKRWPLKLFLHLVDTCALNAFTIWIKNNPKWKLTTKSKRRHFIRMLAYELITPQMRSREANTPNLHMHIRSAMNMFGVGIAINPPRTPASSRATHDADTNKPTKQGRCKFDGNRSDLQRSSRTKCDACHTFICNEHQFVVCPNCKDTHTAH